MKFWKRRYYTLLSSLPALPRFHKAKVLPISRERLEARLRMLADEDANVVEQIWSYFAYERQPMDRTEEQMVAFYERIMKEAIQPTLCAIIDFGMNQRTIVAGLRQRQRRLAAPRPGLIWGGGPWLGHIERHWSEPDFSLSSAFPWITEIRGLLESHQSLNLERRLNDLAWGYLDRLADGKEFTFDAVLIYLTKWSLLNRWLSHDDQKAAARFQHLADQMLRGHDRLFQTTP